MLLGDADVEACASGNALPKMSSPVPDGMAAVMATILSSLRGLLDQALGEHLGVGRRVGLRLGLRAGDDVELDDAVIFVGGCFGRRIALALLGDDMDQDRPVVGVAHVLQDRQQMVEIVAVDRADIVEAELLEQRAAGDQAAGIFLERAARASRRNFGRRLGELLADLAQRAIGARRRPDAAR